jgi:hypothetical protein
MGTNKLVFKQAEQKETDELGWRKALHRERRLILISSCLDEDKRKKMN